MLAQAANDQRIVERIPDDGMNRRADPNPDQRRGNGRRFSLLPKL